MRALLDVNVLLALLEQAHTHHQAAKGWFIANAEHGWSSCPLTENGFVRIIGNPKYARPKSVALAISLLWGATFNALHEFWPADASVLDAAVVDGSRIHGPRQLTDVYLLSLAVRHGGRLVTFDQSIPLSAVPGATASHLVAI